MSLQISRKHALVVSALAVSILAVGPLPAQSDSVAPGPYDFIPGERILYAEDFQPSSSGASAMRRLAEATARLAIDPREGRPFLHTRPPASFVAVLREKLPERFTIDFDMYIPDAQIVRLSTVGTGANSTTIDVGPHSVAVSSPNGVVSAEADRLIADFDHSKTMHYSIAVDGPAVRIYVERVRVLTAPNANFGRTDRISFYFNGGDDPGLIDANPPIWITDIRIAAGGNTFSYDELMAKGRVATQGILFDVGSDRIRPESAPTLKLIGDMLSAHADLKLTIEGHSDNLGAASSNQTLSRRRAEAVTQYLITTFRVDLSRLASVGFGDTRPAAPNSTPLGRQQNRRVELVKQ